MGSLGHCGEEGAGGECGCYGEPASHDEEDVEVDLRLKSEVMYSLDPLLTHIIKDHKVHSLTQNFV